MVSLGYKISKTVTKTKLQTLIELNKLEKGNSRNRFENQIKRQECYGNM